MSDSSERDSRDVGDDTRARIDDLKSGWKKSEGDGDSEREAAPDVKGPDDDETRTRATPPPPPPPGAPTARRPKGASRPPPPPPRVKGPSRPPPPPPKAKIEAEGQRDDESTMIHAGSDRLPRAGDLPAAAAPTRPAENSKALPAPAVQTDRLGQAHEEETALEPIDAPDAPVRTPPPGAVGTRSGSVRALEMLPRAPGVIGDIGYFFRVLFTTPTLRREIRNLEEQLDLEREGRTQRLVEVARNALADTDLDSTLVGKAREHLVTLEEMRSRHAGAVAAAEEDISGLGRQRDDAIEERKKRRIELQEKIASVDKSLGPLQKRQTQARKSFTALRRSLGELDKKIADAEDSLVSVDGPDQDAAEVQAQVASLSAERQSVAVDEPEIAAELDDLEPKIASLLDSRGEFEKEISTLSEGDEADEVRTEEKITAIKARRTVEDRAAADLAGERQDALLVLGESINDRRPMGTHRRLQAIEGHEIKIATLERRTVELREKLANIERWPQLRGGLSLLLIAGVIAAALILTLSR